MDTAAIALARENNIPIIVYSIHEKGGFGAILKGGRPLHRRRRRLRRKTGRQGAVQGDEAMTNGVDFKDLQRRMDGAIAAFKHDLASLRTGRASSQSARPDPGSGLRHDDADQPGGDRLGAGAAHDLGVGLGQIDGRRRRPGDPRIQSRLQPDRRRHDAAHSVAGAQRAAPQGTGEDRASIMPRRPASPPAMCGATAWTT